MLLLLIVLALSVALLLIANVSVRVSEQPTWVILVTGLTFVFVGCLGTSILWPIFLQTMFLCVCLAAIPPERRTFRPYLTASVGSTLLVYGMVTLLGAGAITTYFQELQTFPYESLEGRLSATNPLPAKRLSDDAVIRLTYTEKAISDTGRSRSYRLRNLHENATLAFIRSAGFGPARMVRIPALLGSAEGRREAVPQPGNPDTLRRSIDEAEQGPPIGAEKDVSYLLTKSIVDFVNPGGFGYFEDRQHVRGFLGHGFSKVPNAEQPLRVTSIELVGLLRDKPVVYVSENLPRMQELRDAPTRDVDEFELAGLEMLKKGGDLYTRDIEGGLRMLGAIRSTKQCIDCHGGQRGDLLGAFSYMLR